MARGQLSVQCTAYPLAFLLFQTSEALPTGNESLGDSVSVFPMNPLKQKDGHVVKLFGGAVASVLTICALGVGGAIPADAAPGTITVSFGDWRCSATGGGSVTAVQMGSQYGSVPMTNGRTITIGAKARVPNNLTGAVWCKRPWYRLGVTTPVYNINQGLWVDRYGQNFNV